MDQTSQSPDTLRMTAEREAEQAAAIVAGKVAAAQRQADARAVHAAEVAKRNEADAAMNIPASWSEPRKAVARAKFADRQRAAQVEADAPRPPPKPTPRASLSRSESPQSIIARLNGGSFPIGMPFPKV